MLLLLKSCAGKPNRATRMPPGKALHMSPPLFYDTIIAHSGDSIKYYLVLSLTASSAPKRM